MIYFLIVSAVLLPVLTLAAFLLGRYMRSRQTGDIDMSPVTRQHLELYQGGQLSESAVENAKRRFRELLDRGDWDRIDESLRPGTQFVVQVRALAEIGTDDACRVLERQFRRRLTDNQMEQSWYWIDLANSLRNLNRDESLPLLLECVTPADDFPLVHYFAAETVCFLGFGSFAQKIDTAEGQAALRILHRAIEGLRFGVPPHVVVEARIGEVLESIWDRKPKSPQPLLVRLFAETIRQLRRTSYADKILAEEPLEQEAFRWQLSRIETLEASFQEYIQEAGPALLDRLPAATGQEEQDILHTIDEIKLDAATTLLPLLQAPKYEHAELATYALRWSRDPKVGPFLLEWVRQTISLPRRSMKRKRSSAPRRSSVPAEFPYKAILFTLRHHPSQETEQFLLAVAHDFDPTYRKIAVSSLGWWEPYQRAEVLLHLQDARFDPSSEVRQAARCSLARLGERQALEWFRQAPTSDNSQRIHEAIQAVAVESLTLLWPDLDALADSEDFDVALAAREALEQMQEDFEYRARLRS